MTKYPRPRDQRTPPHVSLSDLRAAVGITLDEVCSRIHEEMLESDPKAKRPTRGTICAIENGTRGASASMLRLLARAYGLPEGAITTDYEPRLRKVS